MYLERKWGTEMSNESQLYSFIEKYLIDKRIEIIQNEVKFYRRLKTLDLLAKSDDSLTYYLIEVKKDKISIEDYYNLKYIIENNNIGKIKNGILIGNCYDKELKELLEKDHNIELIEINNILSVKNMGNNRSINHHKNCYNPYKKYFIKLFEHISDDTLFEFSIIDDYLIKIKYKINDYEYLIFKGCINKWEYIKGNVYIETIEYYFREKISSLIKSDLNIIYLRKILYKIKYDNLFRKDDVNVFFENVNNDCIYSLLDTLSNIIDLKKVKFCVKNKNILEIKDYDLMILKTNINRVLLLPKDFVDLIFDQKDFYDYSMKINEACERTMYNSELNFLEFTNLIVKKELIEPLKTIQEEDCRCIIKLELDLKDNKKVKRSYKVKKIKNIDSADFYLFTNWDIIIDFQKEVNKVVSKSRDIIYEKDYIKSYRWNAIRKNIESGNTNRMVIEKFIEEEIGEDRFLKDFFKRAVWGVDEDGRYTRL